MMKRMLALAALLAVALAPAQAVRAEGRTAPASLPTRTQIRRQFAGRKPAAWGEHIAGVIDRYDTTDKVIALTFDACGGRTGSGYDRELIDFLTQESIPATLFLSGRWMDANPELARDLAANPLFEIENHGRRHAPLSVNGRAKYGIKGTASPGEVYDEIMGNAERIEKLTGRRPTFFRTGTAYYDDVAVNIAKALGVSVAGFAITGDAGASLTSEQIVAQCAKAGPGMILLFHMNHPESDTYEGCRDVVASLREQGYTFARLMDMPG